MHWKFLPGADASCGEGERVVALDLECADRSALGNDATCRVEESGVKPPQSKVCCILNANQYETSAKRVASGLCPKPFAGKPSVSGHRPDATPCSAICQNRHRPRGFSRQRTPALVAQVSKPAVSPTSKSAERPPSCHLRVWKPATQQTWKSCATGVAAPPRCASVVLQRSLFVNRRHCGR